ncbi:unnamed protein product [Adineta steineri]|uniref:Uncharacterized protein n=1 Tax=Adineta steineri TaxID=433720 RepID=A0A813QP46_9BILA|nr:unnamed protein product [Adineta steineri]CAF0770344.1 unnamed protein product [Adineta steineri]
MKKQHDQQLIRLKTLVDSSDDDDDGNLTTASSTSNDNDTDQSFKITNLMRENERKIRTLSESYMNRFLLIGQQLQSVPQMSNTIAMTSTARPIDQRRPVGMMSEMISSAPPPPPPSLASFIEVLKQLIIKEEKKREKSYLPSNDDNISVDLYTRLSHGITQCFRDYEAEVNHAKRRITDLNEQQEHMLNENKHVIAQLTEAFEQNTISVRQGYEKHLAKQREESLKIGQSLDNYKVEVLTLRDSYEKKLRVKDELVSELNERLVKNETEQATRHHALHLKIEQFQQSFETLQARNKHVEQNNQIKIKENRDLLTQISNLQMQIQRLQQTVTSKANECSELSQKLTLLLPKSAECERFESELKQWFLLISPEHNTSDLTLDVMSSIVSSKISYFENYKKQFDSINEDLNTAHICESNHLSDRIRYLINHNKQIEIAHNDINNKYQALLLQVNMLTGIIKQHSTEVANHKTNEEQLKDFNEQLLNENQKIKLEIQEYRSKFLQITNINNQLEHESGLNKQHTRDVQIQFETFKSENQMLTNELQTKRETIKRYEQELQSMKHLFEITLKEKQIQNDQLQHERQLFQTENNALTQLVIRDGHEKSTNQLNFNILQKEMIDNEICQLSNGYTQENYNRFIQMNKQEDNEITEDVISRRATSTPTLIENDNQQLQSTIQPLGITKQINQVLNDMKNLLTFGREVIVKHDDVVPERDFKVRKSSKSRHSRKERATVIGIEQH